ncbi:MAG: hypothetical protein HYV95_00525 [Opitutae bacterium]|nr:hypothetical protein [Opitutae bacterium]
MPMSPALFFRLRLALLLLAGVLAVPGARAQDVTTSGVAPGGLTGSGSRPTPRDPSLARDLSRFPGGSNQPPLGELMPIYFPAPAPVLGAELPPAPAIRDAIWNDLAPYANELFFAPLSTRLAKGDIDRRHRQRLDAYRAARATALAELRIGLEAAHTAPASAPAALANLARKQEPVLNELAGTADALRRDFYRGGFLTPTGDWNQYRNWRLGETGTTRTPQELLYDEFSVIRAAIFYQEGLSPAQRQLLREVVVELSEALGERDPGDLASTFEPEQVVFFLPHGSRLRVPAGISAGLAAEIGTFTAAKTALKRELRDALFNLDRQGDGKREKTLRELATQQEPRFAELETQAERLRLALAALPEQTRPAVRPGLPPALAARIDAYLREKAGLQSAARQQAQEPAPAGGKKAKPIAPDAARAALAAFEEQNRARLATLATEARAIREELARLAASTTSGDGDAKTVDALLADFMSAFKQQQLQSLYRDYRTAVLEPGLSPAQRQLLFDATLATLDLTGAKDWQAVPE